ncbi:hypothetical protein BCR34DRAFT_359482 [Clohesyomyces aquaticus]|uniref:Uncharacterized protein n=1 Tax=Clohesyomyces aquaticus TaxID=1231657 RepID=A0A1Y1ZID9_9PLEO|nr:hypothetical protein BCR34DRAFT_359482 [Clohesyomyces aquaticus]
MLDMGPLVALIGTRLPEHRSLPFSYPSSAITVLRILIELPRMVPQDRNDGELDRRPWVEGTTLGDLLDKCYQRKLLVQPGSSDMRSHHVHGRYAMNALLLVNMWAWFSRNGASEIRSVDENRSFPLDVFWQYSQLEDESIRPFGEAKADSFRGWDLCIDVLRNVCKSRIQWTELIHEHLELDIDCSTLKVFWFGFAAESLPIFYLGCSCLDTYNYCHRFTLTDSLLIVELRNTYAILFRSLHGTYAANLAEYNNLSIPEWLRVLYGNENGLLSTTTAKDMSFFTSKERPWFSDIEFHIETMKAPLPPVQLFEQYVVFERRLRMLQAYVDSQRPGGIQALWRDRRDGLAWYTFWAVIFIGGSGLIVSVLSLGATVAQTIAAFRSIGTH